MFDMLVFSWFCVLRLKNVHFSVLATLCCKKKYPCKMKVTCVTCDAHKQFPRMPLNQKSVTMSYTDPLLSFLTHLNYPEHVQ